MYHVEVRCFLMRLMHLSGSIVCVKVDFNVAVMKVDFDVVRIFAWRSSWILNWNTSSDGFSVLMLSPIVEGRITSLVFIALCLADPIIIVSEYVIQCGRIPFSTLG